MFVQIAPNVALHLGCSRKTHTHTHTHTHTVNQQRNAHATIHTGRRADPLEFGTASFRTTASNPDYRSVANGLLGHHSSIGRTAFTARGTLVPHVITAVGNVLRARKGSVFVEFGTPSFG